MPSISRISSAERCCSGSRPTSSTSRARSSRRCASSIGSCSGLRDSSKISAAGRHRPAQVVDAAVVGDAVQPRAHVHRARVGAQRAVGAHEHVLQHVLGVLTRAGAQHLAHVGEQALAVAVVDHPERVVVAGRGTAPATARPIAASAVAARAGVGPGRLLRGERTLPLSPTLTTQSGEELLSMLLRILWPCQTRSTSAPASRYRSKRSNCAPAAPPGQAVSTRT